MERYRVLGRTSYPEPLELQGTVEADGDTAAAAAALDRFGDRWVELVLLPERAVHWVLGQPARMPVPSCGSTTRTYHGSDGTPCSAVWSHRA